MLVTNGNWQKQVAGILPTGTSGTCSCGSGLHVVLVGIQGVREVWHVNGLNHVLVLPTFCRS
jgi:hypothetical protein